MSMKTCGHTIDVNFEELQMKEIEEEGEDDEKHSAKIHALNMVISKMPTVCARTELK